MKIACISIYDVPYKPVADITVPNLTEYCRRHGYNHHIFRAGPWQRDIVWERIPRILEVLPNYDWVVYFDSDALVTNHFIKLHEFFDSNIVMTESVRENGDVKLNDGVLCVKSAQPSYDALNCAWDMYGREGIFCAQDAFQEMYDGYWFKHGYFAIEKQKRMNSFLYTEYGMKDTTKGHWTVGDFALHLPGRSTDRRVEIFSKIQMIK